jgi:pimeloyl-ACP methyl ester carboxylesterase
MKHNLIAVVLLIAAHTSLSQNIPLWGTIVNVIPAQQYAGKKFKIEAAVKVTLIDKDANAEIWARVDRANKKTGFFNNMMDKPIQSSEWKVYTQQGKIDKDAEWLVFGGMYHKKGIFYFDDFKLFIENKDGIMEQVPLVNGGFEQDSLFTNKSWGHNKLNTNFSFSISTDEFFNGKQSCRVDGSKLAKSTEYGDNDSTGKFATVNGIKIYYEEYGQGQPLLLLHGNSESINSFKLQIPELSKSYHVYAIDTRGHGKSGDDGKNYTYDLFADDMNALLNELHLDSVNILGWSDGGNTGLIMAMKYPKKVKKLITMGAVIFIDKTVVDKWVFKILKKEKKDLIGDSSSFALGRLRRIELLLTEPKHTFEELKQISCPVLVMAGDKDIVREEHTKGIAANIPKGTLLIVPKATHELPWEDAKAFNTAVLEFLKQ